MVEGRHRLAEQRDDAQHRIPRPPARHRREHAGRDADGTRDGERRQRQLRPRAPCSNTSSPAGCPKRMDSPNSNRARLPSQTSSCSRIGRASPGVSRHCCRTSSVVVGGSLMSVGLPGQAHEEERRDRDAKQHRDRAEQSPQPEGRHDAQASPRRRRHAVQRKPPVAARRVQDCLEAVRMASFRGQRARGMFGTWAAASPGRKAAPAVPSSAVRREISVVSLPRPGGTRAAGCRRGSPRPRTC
jgi:hypothetical protein